MGWIAGGLVMRRDTALLKNAKLWWHRYPGLHPGLVCGCPVGAGVRDLVHVCLFFIFYDELSNFIGKYFSVFAFHRCHFVIRQRLKFLAARSFG